MVTHLTLSKHQHHKTFLRVCRKGSIFQVCMYTHTHTHTHICLNESVKEIYNEAKCPNVAQRVIKIASPQTDFEGALVHNRLQTRRKRIDMICPQDCVHTQVKNQLSFVDVATFFSSAVYYLFSSSLWIQCCSRLPFRAGFPRLCSELLNEHAEVFSKAQVAKMPAIVTHIFRKTQSSTCLKP